MTDFIKQLKEVKEKYLIDEAKQSSSDTKAQINKEMEELKIKADPMYSTATGN
jgi:hypothetical protein